MRPLFVLFSMACAAAADVAIADGVDGISDEARIEQLIHHPLQPAAIPESAKAKTKANQKAVADPAATLIGQKVHVRTVDRGLYSGILQSVDAGNVVLRIDLPKQALSYTLPRSGIAELQPAEATP
jgi:hypothetical protein